MFGIGLACVTAGLCTKMHIEQTGTPEQIAEVNAIYGEMLDLAIKETELIATAMPAIAALVHEELK